MDGDGCQGDTNVGLGLWVDTECVISIDRDMIMDTEAKSSLGGVNMAAPGSVELRNIDLSTTTGVIELHVAIVGEVPAIIFFDVGLGGMDIGTTGFSGLDTDMTSDDHFGMNHIGLTLDTTTGGIDIVAICAA